MAPVTAIYRQPVKMLTDGLAGTTAAYLTIALPNWLLPFPGVDFTSRIIRLVTRLAAGGLVVGLGSKVARGSHGAVVGGAAIGAVGSTLFDFLGMRLIVGSGDTGQTPMALLSPVMGAPTGTVGAYARLRAYSRPMLPSAHGHMSTLGAAPSFPARAMVGHRLF